MVVGTQQHTRTIRPTAMSPAVTTCSGRRLTWAILWIYMNASAAFVREKRISRSQFSCTFLKCNQPAPDTRSQPLPPQNSSP